MKNKCYKYEYKTKYLADSTFVETYFNVANKVELINDTFKIRDGKWYYNLDGKYEVLFSSGIRTVLFLNN